jgi:hypothetical protein
MREKLTRILGHDGRMISPSKSSYREKFPENLVVFNANICTSKEKIWYGDIDVTLDREKLKSLASEMGEEIFVLREMDGRFENESRPLIHNFVYKVSPDGEENVGEMYQRYWKD